MNLKEVAWQERYKAAYVYTLFYTIADSPNVLAKMLEAVGACKANIDDISTIGVDGDQKLQKMNIYCTSPAHMKSVTEAIEKISGIKISEIRDEVLEIHRRGAIKICSRVPIASLTDLRMLYTPGVAAMCERIVEDRTIAWEITGICDRVAIVTNGTAVLGLGDIGTLASLPVMEGKAAIFAEFAGISAEPVLVNSKDIDTVVETVVRISESFGAIQLEDIAAPECFAIEEKLRDRLDIPVFHDDQHGTATVLLASLINALKHTGKRAGDCSALILGAGAAGIAIAKTLLNFGLGDIVVYDSFGPIYRGRNEKMNPYTSQLAQITNKHNQTCSLEDGFNGKDIFIGVARPKMVTGKLIASMAKNPIVFPLSNPVGEITVEEAIASGAAIAADGRTVNNALAYPALFRGALDAEATDITFEMQLAAAQELADLAKGSNLLPDILDLNVHKKVAQKVFEAWKNSL